MIGTANLFSQLYYNVLENGDTLLAVLLLLGVAAGLLVCLLCCCTCYNRCWPTQVCGARRGCAIKCSSMCSWPKKAAATGGSTAREAADNGDLEARLRSAPSTPTDRHHRVSNADENRRLL